MKTIKLMGYTVITLFYATFTFAQNTGSFEEQLLALQHQWAESNYSLEGNDQEDSFKILIQHSEQFVADNPDRAESLVWYGIIQSSYAGVKGGIGALSHAKKAKKSFEKALKINPNVLEGSAYTSLGVLYHKVPGWPISFGDDDDARILLEKAISINPAGIDPNYFYAEFLFDKREYEKAKQHLLIALDAPSRQERPLADKSRRAEVNSLLVKVETKIKK